MDLNIIIPVYNTNIETLKRCIQSIIKLKEIKYEIIIVDDGSEEKKSNQYIKVIKEINDKFNGVVKYFKQNNGGVSSARNLGIKKSNAKYIMFVDSDDTIMASSLSNQIIQSNMDVIVYDKAVIKKNTEITQKELEKENGFIDNEYALKMFATKDKFHSPCAKLIKLDLIKKNEISFKTHVIHGEDALFNESILQTNPQIYYTGQILYQYYYDYSTAEKRWVKYPEKMINNIEELYLKKNLIINNLKMFRGCLIIRKNKDINNLNKISIEISKIKIKELEVNISTKVKYYIIRNKKWSCLKILSFLRKIYLKIK